MAGISVMHGKATHIRNIEISEIHSPITARQ